MTKINNTDGDNIILECGVISVESVWCGGSQTELAITLYIESIDKHYDCKTIEAAFSEYKKITEEFCNE